jgi:hypothetical protein
LLLLLLVLLLGLEEEEGKLQSMASESAPLDLAAVDAHGMVDLGGRERRRGEEERVGHGGSRPRRGRTRGRSRHHGGSGARPWGSSIAACLVAMAALGFRPELLVATESCWRGEGWGAGGGVEGGGHEVAGADGVAGEAGVE